MEDYVKWKGEQKSLKIQTLEKLAVYKRSDELVKLISEKIATCEDQSLKDYFVSKLKLMQSDYGDFVAESIQTDVKSAKKGHFEKLISNKQSEVFDSKTLGSNPSRFTPANTNDYMSHHQERNVLSHSEYLRLKDEEMDKEEWKL